MTDEVDDTARDLLARPLLALLGYAGHDGYPRAVPVWFAWQDGAILVESGARSYKTRRLRRHPQASVTIATPETPYLGLVATGDADISLLEEPERLELLRGMARRYLGEEGMKTFLASVKGPSTLIRIRPARIRTWDYTGYF